MPMANTETVPTMKQFAQAFGRTYDASSDIGNRVVTLKQARHAMQSFFPFMFSETTDEPSDLDDRCLTSDQLNSLVENFYLYEPIDYLYFPGNVYINTGVYPNNNMRVQTRINLYSSQPSATVAVFGGRNDLTVATFTLWRMNASSFRYDFGNRQTSISMSTVGDFVIDANKNQIVINSKTVQVANSTFNTSTPLYIGSTHNASSNTPDTRHFRGDLYYFKVYDNGALVRDFIPVKRLSDNKEGLFDTVNKRFYVFIS